MAGIHKYTSSLFVQSGSIAQFKSGIEVTESLTIQGNITADNYYLLDGTPVTGGDAAEFFAGSGSGVSASNPSSVDHVIQLTTGITQTPNTIHLHTTHSSNFTPNHYVFVEIDDEFTTRQSGSQSNYSLGQLTSGVYRYLIYGAQTGSGGETHQVYSTVYIKGFINIAPELSGSGITEATPTIKIPHNENSAEIILHFTESNDPNYPEDYISYYTASRDTGDPTYSSPTSNTVGYALTLNHPNIANNGSILKSSSLTGIDPSDLFFTASITNYNIGNSGYIHHSTPNITEQFEITLKDLNEVISANTPGEIGVTSGGFNLTVIPPDTASISNIRISYEDGGFTNNNVNNYTHVLLYDKVLSLNSASIATLQDRYTSSLVRFKVMTDIVPPPSYDGSELDTTVHIYRSTNATISTSDTTIGHFKILGSNNIASQQATTQAGTYTPLEADNYTSFIGGSDDYWLGAFSSGYLANLNQSTHTKYGDYNHYEAFTNSTPYKLTISPCPDIQISDIVVEVESGSYGTNIGHPNLTSSILYGLTTTLSSSQTQSSITDVAHGGTSHPFHDDYIDQSIVRLRLKCKIQEPFGPDHNNINGVISEGAGNSLHSQTFGFSDTSTDCSDKSVGYENINGQDLYIGYYTSSWVEMPFTEGTYDFTATFNSSTIAGITAGAVTTSTVSMSAVPPTQFLLESGTETAGYSGIPNFATTRTVLYGDSHVTNGDTSSLSWVTPTPHTHADIYASHSVTRFWGTYQMMEPFGPAHHDAVMQIKVKIGGTTYSTIHAHDITPDPTDYANYYSSLNDIDYPGLLITKEQGYTFIADDIALPPGDYGGSATYTVTPNITSLSQTSNNGTDITSTPGTLTVIDTPQTIITINKVETETFGGSNVAISNTSNAQANYSQLSRDIPFGQSETYLNLGDTNDNLTGSNVSRFRAKLDVIEPLGYAQYPPSIIISHELNNTNTYDHGGYKGLDTSANRFYSASSYDSSTRLVTEYTTSFDGNRLAHSNGGYWRGYINSYHGPAGENGKDEQDTNANTNLYHQVIDAAPLVIDYAAPNIETYSGSDAAAGDTRVSNILHGKTKTEVNNITNATYPDSNDRQQLVGVSAIVNITYPPTPDTLDDITVSLNGIENTVSWVLNIDSNDVATATFQGGNSLAQGATISYHTHRRPVQLAAGNHTIWVSTPTSPTTNLASTLTVNGPSNASVYISALSEDTSDADWGDSNSGALTNYFTYDDPNGGYTQLSTTNTVSVTAPSYSTTTNSGCLGHTTLAYSIVSSLSGISIQAGTGVIYANNSSFGTLDTPSTATYRLTATDVEGGSHNKNATITIIPAKPPVMTSNWYGSSRPYGHSLVTAKLPTGLGNYKSGDTPTDTSHTTVSSKVLITHNGTANDYNMSFNTPSGTTGDYGAAGKAYRHGDKGTLQVTINGVVSITKNLTSTTLTNNTTNATGTYSGKANLVVNTGAFNNVTQHVWSEGVEYPNGYKYWRATLNITQKLRTGYNIIEFSHILPGGSTTTITYDWYYDDYISRASIAASSDSDIDWSEYNSTSPVMSLSGVDFFKEGVPFLFDFDSKFVNVYNNTFKSSNSDGTGTVGVTTDPVNFIKVTSGSGGTFTNSKIYHHLINVGSKKGLKFDDKAMSAFVPNYNSVGSLKNMLMQGHNIDNNVNGLGSIGTIQWKVYDRTSNGTGTSYTDTQTENRNTGRFIDEGQLTDSTPTTEYFEKEDYRWASNLSDGTIETSRADYGYFTNTSYTNYNSSANISSTNDLQQVYTGKLIKPVTNYSMVNPNTVNYSTATSTNRYYYRAFKLSGYSGGTLNLTVRIDGSLNRNDIYADGISGIDGKDVRIDIKTPGPLGGNEGSGWTNIYYDVGTNTNTATNGWKSFASDTDGGTHLIVNLNMIDRAIFFTDGVIIMRVRYKSSFTGDITKITLSL